MSGNEIPEQYRPMVEKALQLAQAAGYSGELNKIEAIKFYREASGASLAEAKRVVETVGPLYVGPSRGGPQTPWPTRPTSGGAGFLVNVLVLIAIGVALAVGIITVLQKLSPPRGDQSTTVAPPTDPPPTATPSTPPLLTAALQQPPSQFATLAMQFGSQGIGPAHFDDVRAIAVDNQGHLYVGEYSNGRVQVFDTGGKYLSEFSLGAGHYLQNLIADRNGTVYAVSSSHILRFTGASGAAQGEIGATTPGDPPRSYTDACLAPGTPGVLYAISDAFGGEPQVVKLDAASGKILSSFETKKSVGESLDLFRILATATGELYALDRGKGVFRFTADGRYINRFGGGKAAGVSPTKMPPSQLFSPQNIATDGQGRIYVSDSGSCIKVYDKDGNYLDKFGGTEVAFGIATDDHDNIYAALRNRHTVAKYVISSH